MPRRDDAGQTHATDVAEVAHELRLLAGDLARRVKAEERLDDITATQYSLLARLEREGPLTPGALALAERITSQAVGQALNVLEADDLVERRIDPADGRKILAQVTPAGTRLVDQTRKSRETWLARSLASGLEAEELRTLSASIQVLQRLLRQ
jgi:DNA-binding MarR family transcriptional regulator